VFGAHEREPLTGFVMDFGGLKHVKAWLEDQFDHTLLLDASDPLLPQFQSLQEQGACKLTIFEDVGMEGTAHYVARYVSDWVLEEMQGRVFLVSVECRENDKNSAYYVL
jgi:6-pyruvoyltetrahydropterin/6-carboxytetrahydropterin synthase